MTNAITVQTTVAAPLARVWECWTGVEHIQGWAFASDDWAARGIANELWAGGQMKSHLYAKDGSMGFDFEGTYSLVKPESFLALTLSDGRKVEVSFAETEGGVMVTETFEAENMNPVEMQRDGWQAFLNNFKKYVEG